MSHHLDRREFFRTATSGSVLAATLAETVRAQPAAATTADRDVWVGLLRRLSDPVLTNLSRGTLKARMPVEQVAGATRQTVTHLEALGRLLAGIAPWLELSEESGDEARQRAECRRLAVASIARSVDPASPDALNF